MAESQGNIAPIAGISSAVVAPFVLAIALFFGLQTNSGASAAQPINPAPGSEQAANLNAIQALANPADYLRQNVGQLDTLLTQVTALKANVAKPNAPYTTLAADKRQQAVSLLDKAATDIATLRAAAASGQTGKQETAADLANNITQINTIIAQSSFGPTAATLVEWGRKTVLFNNDGHGSISYSQAADRFNLTGDYPSHIDCSGFITFLMYKAGVIKSWPPNPAPITVDYVNYAKGGTLGFSYVPGFDYDPSADYGAKIRQAAQSGILHPGDLLFSGNLDNNSGGHGARHIVMYVGGAAQQSIVESTEWGGKNGPQYDSLDSRTKPGREVRAVIRPPGV